MPEVFANNATTVVVAGGTTAPTSGTVETWTVASPGVFPTLAAGQSFHVADPASATSATEKIKVTATSGGTWTVVRGDENSPTVAHASGFTVVQVVTAGGYAAFATLDAAAGDIQASPGTAAAGNAGLAADAKHVHPSPAVFAPAGLTGATAATRYAGATASGAPASGTFAVGDFVVDQTGAVWICTVAGTPGTWVKAGPTIPVPIAQGGTGQTAQQAAMDALAGAQSAGKYLRSDGTHTTLAAVQAADVPGFDGVTVTGTPAAGQVPVATSSSAATWQAAGVPQLTFTYGTGGAVPSSGTFTAGTLAVDQNDIVRVCITSGSPGKWRRVEVDPWRFYLDDYGCKGDGKQALVTTVAGSATINTTPLSPPPAPSLSNSGTGGTIAAGTYQVIVTYLNKWGETLGSSSASTTTTGTTSTITITAPALSGNATGWYAYVTQAGGSTYFRQQAAGSPTAMGVGLTLTAPPTSSGANPPGADSSAAQVFTSTAVDAGKNIMICGGLGSPGSPWVDTIATVNSPTQAVLSSNGAGQGGNVSQAGCAMVFASDDRLAVDACISDAKAYALANNNFCQVIGSDKNYGLGTGLFQSVVTNGTGTYLYNTQVRIPDGNPSGETEKLEFHLIGPGDNAHAEFWMSQYINLNGCTFLSFSFGPTTPDPTYGQQSVLGAPAGTFTAGSNGVANVTAVIKGVQVIQPGWSNSIGIDLYGAAGCVVRASSMAFAPTTNNGGGVNPSNNWIGSSFFQGKLGLGMRLPRGGNNDDVLVESFATEGVTTGLYTECDHAIIIRLLTINENLGMKVANGTNNHDLTVMQWSFENVNAALVTGGGAGATAVDIVMDGENSSATDISDSGNGLYGTVRWSDPFRAAGGPANVIAPVITGGANLEITNRGVARQVFGAPTYTLGTALQNPWWRNAWISLSGGTTTGILIGPTSAACTTSVGTTTPATFRLPSGWWVNIQGSVKPTTYIAVLD